MTAGDPAMLGSPDVISLTETSACCGGLAADKLPGRKRQE
jgi:hypothetical protein